MLGILSKQKMQKASKDEKQSKTKQINGKNKQK